MALPTDQLTLITSRTPSQKPRTPWHKKLFGAIAFIIASILYWYIGGAAWNLFTLLDTDPSGLGVLTNPNQLAKALLLRHLLATLQTRPLPTIISILGAAAGLALAIRIFKIVTGNKLQDTTPTEDDLQPLHHELDAWRSAIQIERNELEAWRTALESKVDSIEDQFNKMREHPPV